MELGAFSASLSVKDLAASRQFYETLGFAQVAGDVARNYLILRNGDTTIGLFQGMFDGNLLTFNPGWDAQGKDLESFTDIREIQAALKAEGLTLVQEAEADGSGPASLVLQDPDGNTILIDQHR